jgi:short-subunit dehydrogenase
LDVRSNGPKIDIWKGRKFISLFGYKFNIDKTRVKSVNELFKKLKDEIWEFRTLYNKTQYRIFGFWDKTASEHTNMLTFNTFGFSSIYKTISFLSTPHF